MYKHKNVPLEQGTLVPGYEALKKVILSSLKQLQKEPSYQADNLDSRATVTFVRKILYLPEIISPKALKNKGEIDFSGVHLYPGTNRVRGGYVPGYKRENVPPKQGTVVPGYKSGNALYTGVFGPPSVHAFLARS